MQSQSSLGLLSHLCSIMSAEGYQDPKAGQKGRKVAGGCHHGQYSPFPLLFCNDVKEKLCWHSSEMARRTRFKRFLQWSFAISEKDWAQFWIQGFIAKGQGEGLVDGKLLKGEMKGKGGVWLNWPDRILAEDRPGWPDTKGRNEEFDWISRMIRFGRQQYSLNWLNRILAETGSFMPNKDRHWRLNVKVKLAYRGLMFCQEKSLSYWLPGQI